MSVEKAAKCPVCHGYGRRDDGGACQRCGGRGEVLVSQIRNQMRPVGKDRQLGRSGSEKVS
jgi:DnaJ-class molecular chaperone